ncbi:MAG: cupin domain-containing protein [Candidatus Acidiferrales bacterium]
MKRVALILGMAIVVLAVGAESFGWRSAAAPQAKQKSSKERIRQALPPLDGDNLTVTLLEVTYPPGTASESHSHSCPVIGYVIEGTMRSQVKGQAAKIYEAGDSFYEPPNGVHAISRNASDTKPARLLAYFLCDKAGPLSSPSKSGSGGAGE